METKILNGTQLRDSILRKIKIELEEIKARSERTPGIAFIACLGDLPLMKYTIELHVQTGRALGFDTRIETFAPTAREDDLLQMIDEFNSDVAIDAIVLLQPLPKHLNTLRIIQRIDKNKEVEGFHPQNVIDTLSKGLYRSNYPMCLPTALLELFVDTGVRIKKGQEFVFAVDQDFLSNPFRSMVLRVASSQVVPADCSLTFVSTDNEKLRDFCQRADFLFVISENPEFLPAAWLKPGVCIVDIYSNLVEEIPSRGNPAILVPIIRGGVKTAAVKGVAGKIAPCPGGLMPVLLAILFRNTLIAYKTALNATLQDTLLTF